MNSRALLISFAISVLTTVLPAGADVTIRDIQFRRQGEDLGIRVVVKNRAKVEQAGPVKITLFVRPDDRSEWVQATSWEDITKIGSQQSVTREISADQFEALKNTVSNAQFQAKAVVEAPGAETATKIATNSGLQKI